MQISSEVSLPILLSKVENSNTEINYVLPAGAGAALFGSLGAGAVAGVPQGFSSGAGQIPAGVALPGAIGGGLLIATAPAFVAGVALLLVPIGLSAVAVFPPFERPRSPGFENTVAVIHTEEDEQLQPRHLRQRRSISVLDEVPSKLFFLRPIDTLIYTFC